MRSPLAAASAALLSAACATSSPPPAAAAQAAPPSEKAGPLEVASTGVTGQASAVRTQTVTATVKSVDVAGRTVTLEWQGGQMATVPVSPEMKRFDELYVGDVVQATMQQELLLQYQSPGSANVPFTVTGGAARASEASAPGGVAAAGVQATVTVTAVDLAARKVTFQDPAGAIYSVKAGPGLRIEKLKAGDRLLATYLEAAALRLEKPPKTP